MVKMTSHQEKADEDSDITTQLLKQQKHKTVTIPNDGDDADISHTLLVGM